MPNIKSAKKRVATNDTKKLRNKAINTRVRSAIKKFNAAIDSNNIAEAEAMLPETFSVIDSAMSKGAIHKNTAANKKSGLAKRLSDVKSGAVVIKVKKDNKTIAAEKALAAKESREAVRLENVKKAAERAALREEEQKEKAKSGKKPAKKEASSTVKAEPKKAPAKKTKDADESAKKEPAKKAVKNTDEPAKKEAKKPLKKLSDKM